MMSRYSFGAFLLLLLGRSLVSATVGSSHCPEYALLECHQIHHRDDNVDSVDRLVLYGGGSDNDPSRIFDIPQYDFSVSGFLDKLFGRRIFNSTMNVIVPMFQVMLPNHAGTGSSLHLAMQALFGLFSFVAWAITVGVPSMYSYVSPFGLRSIRSDSFFHADTGSFWESPTWTNLTDWNICMQKAICNANDDDHKNTGLLSRIISSMFRPPPLAKLDNDLWTTAAKAGHENGKSCHLLYNCFYDPIELAEYLIELTRFVLFNE